MDASDPSEGIPVKLSGFRFVGKDLYAMVEIPDSLRAELEKDLFEVSNLSIYIQNKKEDNAS